MLVVLSKPYSLRWLTFFLLPMQLLERPQNDRCSGALSLPDFPAASVVSGDTTAAYPGFSSVPCGVDELERGIWYSFIPEMTGRYKAILRKYSFDAGLSLFSGNCDSLTCLASREFCRFPGNQYTYCNIDINWNAAAGTTYYFLVHGTDRFSDAGSFEFVVQVRM